MLAPDALVIGAGPAGLMAAEELSKTGAQVIVVEAKPTVARKFLMAGKSGLNVTKDESWETFVTRYDAPQLLPILQEFGPGEVQAWCRALGHDIYTGSSDRIFPVEMKASPLLRSWLQRLTSQGVTSAPAGAGPVSTEAPSSSTPPPVSKRSHRKSASSPLIVAARHFVTDYGWALVLGGFLAGLLLRGWLRTPAGVAWWDRRVLSFPVLGEVMRKYEITRFARSMGTLLRNGVPIVTAIRIASETMGNQLIRASMVEVAPAIKRGGRLADAMSDAGLFTPLALNMVRLGEETGRLDEMLLEVARVHDGEVQSGVKRALQMVEPVLILLMGGIIAVIIVSILMGILSVNDLAG